MRKKRYIAFLGFFKRNLDLVLFNLNIFIFFRKEKLRYKKLGF